jgi:NhaP-type Na+/H+ or K+/H+ antiporter
LGAIISPTDPVVASSIVTGRLSEHSLPNHLRSTLSLESGANDGLAYLIVLLPLLLLQEGSPSAAMEKWLLEALIIGVVLALVLGAVIGYLAARALHHAERIGWMERNSLLGLSVALSLAVVAFAKVLGSDGILAAFAAGTAFNFGIDRNEEFEEQRVQETIGELFNLPVFVIFGAMLPWAAWAGLGGAGWGFAAAILVLRRPLALLVTGPWLGAGLQRRDIAFLGWFGPVGVAAIYYALHVRAQTENPVFWHVTSLVVFTSIIAHGITSGPGLTAYARAEQRTTELRTL